MATDASRFVRDTGIVGVTAYGGYRAIKGIKNVRARKQEQYRQSSAYREKLKGKLSKSLGKVMPETKPKPKPNFLFQIGKAFRTMGKIGVKTSPFVAAASMLTPKKISKSSQLQDYKLKR
tara:strand:+ start:5584 stop:5943 length:360 start_codon:yes stop_codon:yes gene_type:complete